MHRRQALPDELRVILDSQAGVITTSQLIDGGLTPAVIHRMSGEWLSTSQGIHLTGPVTWEAAAWAGLLRGGPSSALGEEAAAYLHGAVRDPPSTIAVWAAARRDGFVVGPWRILFRCGRRASMGSMRRTRLDASLVDMAGRVSEDSAVAAVTRAFAQNKTTPGKLLAALEARRRTRHSAVLRELCGKAGEGIESALEWRFSRIVARHGLPAPERQIVDGASRIDARFGEQGLVVELDGARDHTDWSRDMMRDNRRLIETGDLTLRYGWNAVAGQPCAVVAQVVAALASRGWTGSPRRCRHCG